MDVITERMQNAKNIKLEWHVRENDILSAVKDISASYNKASDLAVQSIIEDSAPRYVYPNIRDTMEDLLEIAIDHSLVKGEAATNEEPLRITAIQSLEKCLAIVSDAKSLHEKLPKQEKAPVKEDIVKKHFAAYMSPQTEDEGNIEWPRKIICGEDLLGGLKEISMHPFNTTDVQTAASDAYAKCERHLNKLGVNHYSADSRWIASKDRGMKNNQVV